MLSFLKIIRLPNLLMMVLTQYLVRYCLLEPIIVGYRGESFGLNHLDFFLIVFSTFIIGASGYLINDYFDIGIDKINKPGKNLIGKQLAKKKVINIYLIFSITGIVIGFWIGYKIDLFELGYINAICSGALWFYSSSFKKQFLIGNLLIALLAGLVPIVIALYDLVALPNTNEYISLFNLVGGYAIFAFLITLVREIIKDIEDVEGDKENGCQTIPIKLGIPTAKWITILLSLITISAIGYFQYNRYIMADFIVFYYLLIAVQLPFLLLLYKLLKAEGKADFHFCSSFTKVIMLTGIFSMIAVYLSLSGY